MDVCLFTFDIGIRDAAHVHGWQIHGLDNLDDQGLGVEVILELVLQLAQVL